MEFEPVNIADLIAESAELIAHCRTCGHHKVIQLCNLPVRLFNRSVPSLEGVFRCSMCGGRNTCARPLYSQQKHQGHETGRGWIMPPAE